MFSPWDVVEVRIEGIGYKHYKTVKSFINNANALIYCDKMNGVDREEEKVKAEQARRECDVNRNAQTAFYR